MKLRAQRNISVDLFEADANDLVLIGTLQDNEHLIKLEVVIHIPDGQVTRSRLEMIRAPFPVCHEIEAIAESLVGLQIKQGVVKQIAERVGGGLGCSHVKEIAANIVYFAGSYLARRRAGMDPVDVDTSHLPPEERFQLTVDALHDSCLAYSQTTPLTLDAGIRVTRVGVENTCPVPLGDYETSMGLLLKDRAQRWGGKVYLRYRLGDETLTVTWDEFADRVFQIARNLLDLNIRAGDRVCVISPNRIEMYLFEMAVVSIGAISIPVFAGYPKEQLAYVLRHSRPKIVVVAGMRQLAKIERESHACVAKFYCMDFDKACEQWGGHDFALLTQKGGATSKQLDDRLNGVKAHHLCMIMYTSGTTGPPKGVKLTHRNLISQQKAISLLWDVDENDVFMSYLPWHHSFGGLFERFMSLYNGCELCLDDSRGRDIDRLIENWRAFNPSLFFSVPRVHDLLLARCREEPEVSRIVLDSKLRFVFTAAAPLPTQVEAAYRERDIPVQEGWGLTETSPCVTVKTKEHSWRSGYVGFPLPGVSVRIGRDKEILVKGPNVMEGYLDDDEATARIIDKDGWLHTGDMGEFTKDGLRIFGRKDGAFKLTSGEVVHPQRIENTLANESPYIDAAVVFGSGEDYVGALIYPNLSCVRAWAQDHGVCGESLTDDPAVRELFASEIERIRPVDEMKYQRIRRVILADHEPSLERGELTPSSKIVRKKVRESYKSQLDAMFEPTTSDGVIEIPQTQLQRT